MPAIGTWNLIRR